MNNIYRFIIAVIAILVIGFFAIKPYNNFCNLKGVCKPIYWYQFFPKKDGEIEVAIRFKALNYHEKLEFEVVKPEVIRTFNNRINTVEFRVKNISQQLVNFRPQLIIQPIEFAQYFDKYECLCMQNYSLRAGEERTLKMIFSFKEQIEQIKDFGNYYQIDSDISEAKEINIMYSIPNTY